MDVGVEHGLLAGVLDLLLDLFPGLGVHLLDLGRVDATVGHQLGQRQAGDLAAHRVEAGEHHGLGRVVDDEVDAGEVLQGADVAALAADDAALHVVGRQRHHRHGGVGHVAGGRALDADGEDVLGPPVALVPGLFLDGPHHLGHVVPDLVLGALEDDLAAWSLRQPGDLFQLPLLLGPGLPPPLRAPCGSGPRDRSPTARAAPCPSASRPEPLPGCSSRFSSCVSSWRRSLISASACSAQLVQLVLELHPRFTLDGLGLPLGVLRRSSRRPARPRRSWPLPRTCGQRTRRPPRRSPPPGLPRSTTTVIISLTTPLASRSATRPVG